MIDLRVQINPHRRGCWQGGGATVLAHSVEAAIAPLDALPGDALWVEAIEGDCRRWVYLVQDGPHGLFALPDAN